MPMWNAIWAFVTSMNKPTMPLNPSRKPLHWLLGCALLVSTLVRADCDFDEFPQVPGMQVNSIAENLQWNNLPMLVKGFRVEASQERVQAFYSGMWEDTVDFSEWGPWLQITHIDEDCMMMVQVQTRDGNSFGRLMLVNPPDADRVAQPLGAGVPIPPDAAVVSDMKNEDDFRDGRMVMLASSDNLEASVAWYETELTRSGWRQEQRLLRENDATLGYSKGGVQLSVVFLRHGEYTQILLNRMDR